ncbi:NAD(+) diphosphatase [Vibrio sp. V27_P1S3P104]|uniref:NAD(+) diphosphatase n=2 Tax=Vibrionaceae TaxID=641 RepID=UPI000C169799|nr:MULTISPECIES: NAD(+) diphosphatase [Vibrio]NAW69657.1 NAD(+) diphosphatase [Vibrio sp. V28_P6S34P95]NAX06138.1 NAD(+) diphosphatase [Vibrio sp. V30_P3S12P165]NAX34198.1 NAD(+) diphosphatase [Vibrio sp. V29_P1S30P107]NAX36386.1 NAD(+) diphosphatase [Vibrio sp. V27_P1S3P104]NAX39979.1 NAD(+) diphosphatase [Vibrio sp. V26_P1S5P106]
MLENSDQKSAYWCVVSGSEIWTVNDTIPQGCAEQWNLPSSQAVLIGYQQEVPIYWINAQEIDCTLEMTHLRELLHFDDSLFLMASKAIQYGHMSQTMRFCPQCGGRNYLNHHQLAMQCQECRTLHYPRIFPCIIVAVRHQQQILLAQHPRHRNGMYTVIAGFVEAGETLEQCVAREIKEETGILVKNIRYFGSQPWPFPSSMMMAFLADYASGELKPDYSELTDAQWFSAQSLPPLAPKGTIARSLIEHTLVTIQQETVGSISQKKPSTVGGGK